jgi:ankyrin repeat protein
MAAADSGQKAAVEWLLQQGVPINSANNAGYTVLHIACGRFNSDHAAVVELLLANGADVYKCTIDGQTSIQSAVAHGNVQCAKALIAAGADVNDTDSKGISTLHRILVEPHAAIVQLLLDNGARAVLNDVVPLTYYIGERCCTGLTAFMMCTDIDTVKVLLAAGADVAVTNDVGQTCLHVAAELGLTTAIVDNDIVVVVITLMAAVPVAKSVWTAHASSLRAYMHAHHTLAMAKAIHLYSLISCHQPLL